MKKEKVTYLLMVMENITYCRNQIRQYDLKGALHKRLVPSDDVEGNVLLDQNFVKDMNVSSLYVSEEAKRNLRETVLNDTEFLNVSLFFDI